MVTLPLESEIPFSTIDALVGPVLRLCSICEWFRLLYWKSATVFYYGLCSTMRCESQCPCLPRPLTSAVHPPTGAPPMSALESYKPRCSMHKIKSRLLTWQMLSREARTRIHSCACWRCTPAGHRAWADDRLQSPPATCRTARSWRGISLKYKDRPEIHEITMNKPKMTQNNIKKEIQNHFKTSAKFLTFPCNTLCMFTCVVLAVPLVRGHHSFYQSFVGCCQGSGCRYKPAVTWNRPKSPW